MNTLMKHSLPLLALFLFSCGSNPSENQAASKTARMNQDAPLFSLQSTKGKTINLVDYKGKVVLLDFWATWCPPCRMSTPAVKKLYEKMKGNDFEVLSISLDEEREAVPPFIQREAIGYPVLYADDSIQAVYRVRAIPTFVLIDKNGVISKIYQGFDPSMEAEWERQISTLLK